MEQAARSRRGHLEKKEKKEKEDCSLDLSLSPVRKVDVCMTWWRTQQCTRAGCPRRHSFLDADEEARYQQLHQRRLQSIDKEQKATKVRFFFPSLFLFLDKM